MHPAVFPFNRNGTFPVRNRKMVSFSDRRMDIIPFQQFQGLIDRSRIVQNESDGADIGEVRSGCVERRSGSDKF